MPDQPDPSKPINDEQLLANAIPIDVNATDANDSTDHDAEGLTPLELDESSSNVVGSTKIRTFETRKPHEDHWKRTPNVTGSGAIHVKTFVTKLRLDAVQHLDDQVNEWLDNHPEYEVKFVSQSVGRLMGKNTEDAMFLSVWV